MSFLQMVFEAAWDVSIIPLGNQNTFYANLLFDKSSKLTLFFAPLLGACLGILLNIFIGKMIHNFLLERHGQDAQFINFRKFWQDAGWPLLLLTWAPLGSILPLLATALGQPVKQSFILCALSMAGFYIYQIVIVA